MEPNFSQPHAPQQIPTLPPEQPTSPIQEKKTDKRFITAIVIAVLGFLTAGVLAFMLFSQKDSSSNSTVGTATTNNETDRVEEGVETAASIDPYEGWGTFPTDDDHLSTGVDIAYLPNPISFRFPLTWQKMDVCIDCLFTIGESGKGSVTFGYRTYLNNQTVDSYTNSLASNDSNFLIAKTINLDSDHRAIIVEKTEGGAGPTAGRKSFIAFIDNLKPVTDNPNAKTGWMISYSLALDNTAVTSQEAFFKDAEKVIQSFVLEP